MQKAARGNKRAVNSSCESRPNVDFVAVSSWSSPANSCACGHRVEDVLFGVFAAERKARNIK